MDQIRTPLNAIQWERAKGELRAMAALLGSHETSGANPYDSPTYTKWKSFEVRMNRFMNDIENNGLHE